MNKQVPNIVTIIGSSRFKDQIHKVAATLEKKGILILMSSFQHTGELSEVEREILRTLDRYRIDIGDEVIVVCPPWAVCPVCTKPMDNPFKEGISECCSATITDRYYYGSDTKYEIGYARNSGKVVHFVHDVNKLPY